MTKAKRDLLNRAVTQDLPEAPRPVARTVDLDALATHPERWKQHRTRLLERYRDWATRQVEI